MQMEQDLRAALEAFRTLSLILTQSSWGLVPGRWVPMSVSQQRPAIGLMFLERAHASDLERYASPG